MKKFFLLFIFLFGLNSFSWAGLGFSCPKKDLGSVLGEDSDLIGIMPEGEDVSFDPVPVLELRAYDEYGEVISELDLRFIALNVKFDSCFRKGFIDSSDVDNICSFCDSLKPSINEETVLRLRSIFAFFKTRFLRMILSVENEHAVDTLDEKISEICDLHFKRI